jgi:transcription antitermination factor NusA-like protein
LDKICVKSGILCPNCQRKVDTGIVGKYEIPIMRELMFLEDEMKELRKGEYVKAYEVDNMVIVLVKGFDNQEELDKISRRLSERLGRKARLVNLVNDQRKLVEQVIAPATLLGLNTVWMLDGREEIIVRVARRDQRFLAGRKKKLEELLSKILGRSVRIRFERA